MVQRIFSGFLLFVLAALPVAGAEKVTLKGADQTVIVGKLSVPAGKGPFPALVVLRGPLGQNTYYDAWAERLDRWGYVTLQIDGFGSECPPSDSNLPSNRAQCLCDVKSYLAGLSYVDTRRIGLMAWSQRGAGALTVYCARIPLHKSAPPFRAGVVFYPYCYKALGNLDFPLLVLIGDQDERAPVDLCRDRTASRKSAPEFRMKVYPKASHYFDVEGANQDDLGRPIRYDPEAAADTIIQVEQFLGKYLK